MVSKTLKEEGEKFDKKTIVIVVLVILLGLFGWLLFTPNIPDNRSGIDEVRDHLQSVREQQQSALDRIEVIESGIADAKDTADRVDASISTSQGLSTDSAGLIAEGQSILGDVRQRDKK